MIYARTGGTHYHTTKKCPLLSGTLFISWHYKEITWGEVSERKLKPCKCVKETK